MLVGWYFDSDTPSDDAIASCCYVEPWPENNEPNAADAGSSNGIHANCEFADLVASVNGDEA